ncbi:MAG: hypothetical protein H0X24_17460 [Ktedonobacterales bacterium]|nr:hypothetical protein [Ktedonobacterales bacterium]
MTDHNTAPDAPQPAPGTVSRRRWLRGALTLGTTLVGAEAVGLGATFLFPQEQTRYNLGLTRDFPAALPAECSVAQQRGIFSLTNPKCFLIHLAAETPWQEGGTDRAAHLDADLITSAADGSYWLAIAKALPYWHNRFLQYQECNRTFVEGWGGTFFDLIGDAISGPFPTLHRYPLHIDHQQMISIPRTPTVVPNYLWNYPYDEHDQHRLVALQSDDYGVYCPGFGNHMGD